MENTLITLKNYGHIEIRLKELMEEKAISRNALARAINARFEVIDKWYNGRVERIDADILARICFVLKCPPEDIIVYVQSEGKSVYEENVHGEQTESSGSFGSGAFL